MRGYRVQCEPTLCATHQGRTHFRLWQPSPFLDEVLDHLAFRPGARAADLGCGSGREAVALAQRGFAVDAYDCLPDALDKARDLANRNGVHVTTVCQDLKRNHQLPSRAYNLISMFRFFERSLLPPSTEALAPAGLIAIETFHADDPKCGSSKGLHAWQITDCLPTQLTILLRRELVWRSGRAFTQIIARRSQ